MTQNPNPYVLSDDGGVLKSPVIFKFIAIIMVLGCGIVYYFAFFQHPWKPVETFSDVISLIGAFLIWPLIALVWVSWSFTEVKYSQAGIEVHSGWGTKRTVHWNSIIGVENYRRFGARRFCLVDEQKNRISIDATTESFLDFLSYVEQHLSPDIKKEVRFTIEAARNSSLD